MDTIENQGANTMKREITIFHHYPKYKYNIVEEKLQNGDTKLSIDLYPAYKHTTDNERLKNLPRDFLAGQYHNNPKVNEGLAFSIASLQTKLFDNVMQYVQEKNYEVINQGDVMFNIDKNLNMSIFVKSKQSLNLKLDEAKADLAFITNADFNSLTNLSIQPQGNLKKIEIYTNIDNFIDTQPSIKTHGFTLDDIKKVIGYLCEGENMQEILAVFPLFAREEGGPMKTELLALYTSLPNSLEKNATNYDLYRESFQKVRLPISQFIESNGPRSVDRLQTKALIKKKLYNITQDQQYNIGDDEYRINIKGFEITPEVLTINPVDTESIILIKLLAQHDPAYQKVVEDLKTIIEQEAQERGQNLYAHHQTTKMFDTHHISGFSKQMVPLCNLGDGVSSQITINVDGKSIPITFHLSDNRISIDNQQ